MRRTVCALLLLGVTATWVMAGPNAGGTMVVHDANIVFSTPDDLLQPPTTTPPVSCEAVDNDLQFSASETQFRVWKVYAAFPAAGSPRLMALVWGIDGVGWSYSRVVAAGLPDPSNCFEVVQGGWPNPSPGASIGQRFVIPQTSHMVECYWFGGYAYEGEGFATVPHVNGVSSFVDDAVPANPDLIEGFSSIGFGHRGTTVCPVPIGACCRGTACTIRTHPNCTDVGGVWHGEITTCSPNPCLPPTGSCCFLSGECQVTTQYDCPGQWTMFGVCTPNPCVPHWGACCYPDGTCAWTSQPNCTGIWTMDGICTPNPCAQPTGACCFPDESCLVTLLLDCPTGVWTMFGTCEPNLCFGPPGSCCHADGSCEVTYLSLCDGDWTMFGACVPNPCLGPLGACCHPDGSCEVTPMSLCDDFWMVSVICFPNPCVPPTGACCFADGSCQVLTQVECDGQGVYQGDNIGCTPTLCPVAIPTEQTSWGRVKNIYR
jgi:hypothetical protein